MEIATKIAPLGLALIMLGLGLSLTIQDFIRVCKIPKDVLVGFISQIILLPNIGTVFLPTFSRSTRPAARQTPTSCVTEKLNSAPFSTMRPTWAPT